MKQFRTMGDVYTCHFDDSETESVVRDALRSLMRATTTDQSNYDPTTHGWVVLLESTDAPATWQAFFGRELQDITWAGAARSGNHILAVVFCNNEFGWTVVVPNRGDFLPSCAQQSLLVEVK